MPLHCKNSNHSQFIKKGELQMITIIEKPINQAIQLEELKNHLRIVHDTEDEYLTNIINTATETVERLTGRSIMIKKYLYTSQTGTDESVQFVELPIIPVINVCFVRKIIDLNTKPEITNFNISHNYGKTVVSFFNCGVPIEIGYYAGITNSSDSVPSDLKYAILRIAKNIYECAEQDFLNSSYIKNIINNYKNTSII